MKHSLSRLDRRAFLAALAAAPLAAAACGRRKYDPARFQRPAVSPVFLAAVTDYAADVSDVVLRGMRELGVTVTGKRVLLKPNLVEYEPGAAINTNPSVIVGTAIAMRQAGAAEVVVGEGPGHQRDIEYLLTATGLSDHLRGASHPLRRSQHRRRRMARAGQQLQRHGPDCAAGVGAERGPGRVACRS